MSRTRRWEFVKQDVIRCAALGLSDLEIARRLDLDRATVFRWRKAGKLRVEAGLVPVRTPAEPGVAQVSLGTEQTPAQWAASVRAAFALDVTDNQLVSQGEAALEVSHDPAASATLRFQAMREFRATVKQLSLVTRQEVLTPVEEKPKRAAAAVQRRSGADPRALLQVVK